MNGQAKLNEIQPGEDFRNLRETLNTLIRGYNRTLEIKLPAGATIAAKVIVTDEKVTFDFSQMGLTASTCTNGQAAQVILLGVTQLTSPP